MEEQNKSSYDGPFWRSNGAIFIVLNALEDTKLTLGSIMEETGEIQDALEEHYSKYNDDSSDEAMEAFSDICEDLWQLVGQLASEHPLIRAAPEPARRCVRARSRRRLRLPFQTKGVGFLFHPSTVCSNQSMICWGFLGC